MIDETYLRVHIQPGFGHASSRAQPLTWPVTVSEAGGNICGGNLEVKSRMEGGGGGGAGGGGVRILAKRICDILNLT